MAVTYHHLCLQFDPHTPFHSEHTQCSAHLFSVTEGKIVIALISYDILIGIKSTLFYITVIIFYPVLNKMIKWQASF